MLETFDLDSNNHTPSDAHNNNGMYALKENYLVSPPQ